ncbi:MAG: FHA domain-containing protein [Ahniella sp.]|nr:FHA domain-containing protein [Ahniella sp.]
MSSELAKAALAAVNLSPVDGLAALREKLLEIETRLEQMDNMAGSVSNEVLARVKADYEAKRDGVIGQARPLYEQVMEEYQKLKSVLGDLEQTEKRARLAREEIDFRHKLGEFDSAELKQRLAGIDAEVGDAESVLADVKAMRERFIAAVGDESELDGEPEPEPEPEPEIVTEPIAESMIQAYSAPTEVAPEPKMDGPTGHLGAVTLPPVPQLSIPDISVPTYNATTPMPAPTPILPPASRPAPPPVPSTMVMQAIRLPIMGTEPAPAAAGAPAKPGRLVPQNPEAGRQTHVATVKALSIGAAPESDVRIGGPGIENRHAELRPSFSGFTLVDLDSRTGTRVNGERVNSRLLEDEDVITIGASRFVFRLS